MRKEIKSLLKNSKFVYIWLSQIFSQLTIQIMNFLLLIHLFSNTSSTIATSFLWISYSLPALLIGPFGAASVDMISKRKVLMITNLLQSFTILGYGFLFTTNIYLSYFVVFLYSLLNQFYLPAEAASIPSVVPGKSLAMANGLFFLTQQASIILGFGFAGVLNHLLGGRTTVFLVGFFMFMAFLSVSFLPEMRPKLKLPKTLEDGVIEFFTRIVEGYNFIKENKFILFPFLLLMGLQIFLSIFVINLPLMAREIFHENINLIGPLIVAPAGLGAALGTFFVSKMIKIGWRKKKIIETALVILSVNLIFITFFLEYFTPFPKLLLSIIFNMVVGLSFVGIVIPCQTYLQEATPGGLRGRVFGNFWFLTTLASIAPVFFSATITELFGVKTLLIVLEMLILGTLIFSKRYARRYLYLKKVA